MTQHAYCSSKYSNNKSSRCKSRTDACYPSPTLFHLTTSRGFALIWTPRNFIQHKLEQPLINLVKKMKFCLCFAANHVRKLSAAQTRLRWTAFLTFMNKWERENALLPPNYTCDQSNVSKGPAFHLQARYSSVNQARLIRCWLYTLSASIRGTVARLVQYSFLPIEPSPSFVKDIDF